MRLCLAAVIAGLSLIAQQDDAHADEHMHARTEFRFTLSLPLEQAAPLFGAWEEQKWAADWKPKFLYPVQPADREGAVFEVAHGSHTSVWVTTRFDLPAGRVQYVNVIDRIMATKIDITLLKAAAGQTDVHVVYERTALDPGANERVASLAKRDEHSGAEWKAAIEEYIRKLAH